MSKRMEYLLHFPVRMVVSSLSEFRSRTVVEVAFFPWVARSEYLLIHDMAIVRNHLPRTNRVGGGLHRRPLTPPDVLAYHGGFYQFFNLS